MTDDAGWERTSPLAAFFYLGKVYQAIARNAFQSLAPLAALVVAFRGNPVQSLMIGMAFFVAVTLVLSFLRYWFFRYRILEDSILIRQGVLHKKQLDIKFERVQAVNTEQNVIYRFFNLLTVRFDTAGSAGQEGYLPAVQPQVARALAERIRRTPKAVAAQHRPEKTPGPLLRLTAGDILRTGLSSGRVFLLLVLLGPIGEYVSEKYGERLEENAVIEALAGVQLDFATGITLAVASTFALVALLAGLSVAAAFLRYHRYSLFSDDGTIHATGGLFTRHETAVSKSKIQSLYVTQNVMLRIFGRYRLKARQIASGKAPGRSTFLVPICRRQDLVTLGKEFFPEELDALALDPRSPSFLRVSPHYLRSRILIAGIIPAMALLALLWTSAGSRALFALLWIPLASLAVLQRYRRYGITCDENSMAFRSGFAGFQVVGWLHRKVQRVTVTQSPFQRRKRLATLRLHLAAGPAIRIPFVEQDMAMTLRDYVLWRVESSRRPWH